MKDEDDDDDLKKKRKPVDDFSSKKSLFELMPAPKSSRCLGIGAATVSSGRRSAVEADDAPYPKNAEGAEVDVEEQMFASGGPVDRSSDFVSCGGGYDDDEGYYAGASDWVGGSESNEGYYNNGGGDWDYSTSAAEVESETVAALPLDMSRVRGKRGRNSIPLDIVEVKQDELVKNRPREDQVKLTGIAFGPAYQPVSSSQKGKPSKLQKRKHQIGSLYFDMRQKEMELTERRSKGMLTKKETQGKYGW